MPVAHAVRQPYGGGPVAMDKRGKVQLPKLKFLVGVSKRGREVVRDDVSTNRSLPANYGSSLQPINQKGHLVQNGHDPYTAYQSDRMRGGRQFNVVRDRSDEQVKRGASSAPGHKKPDRSRPLPKINNLVRGKAPDPLERHLRQPAHRQGNENLHEHSQQNGLPETDANENGDNAKPDRVTTHQPNGVHSSQHPSNVHPSSKFKPYPTRNRRRDRSSSPSEVPEHLISPPKSGRTIYFGPKYGQTDRSKSRMQEDRDNLIRRQLALGHSNHKGGILRNKSSRSKMDDAATTTSYRTDREGTKSTIVPRRERTRMQVNRARSELISRAKTKDDVRIRRTRNVVAVPTTQGTRREKIDRDIYKLEEQMRIYLQMNGMSNSAVDFDAMSRVSGTTFATSRASSPAKKKRNPYTDPKRTVPPWHRKEYILNKRESQMYQHISKVYGNEKLRQNRENAFYKKVEALQLEEWNRLWDEYERKIRERDNKRQRQQVQLQNVRDKFTDDRWERIAKFPVNRIPVHDEDDRHDYGLPVELNENPEEYIPRVGATAKPKETFDTDKQTVKNVKRFHPIFQGFRGGQSGKAKHAPKMEGVDVVVLSDEDGEDNDAGGEGRRQKRKRVKVDALVRDAENAVEGASDESEWEDIEDAEDLNKRLRRTNKAPMGRPTNRSRVGFANEKSTVGQSSTRPTPANSRLGVYNSTQPKKLREKSIIGKQASQPHNASEPKRVTQDAYKPVGKSRFRPTVGDFRSGTQDGSTETQKRPKQASTMDGKKSKGRTSVADSDDQEAMNDPASVDKSRSENKEGGDGDTEKEINNSTQNRTGEKDMENAGHDTKNDPQDSVTPHDEAKSGEKSDDPTKATGDDDQNGSNEGKDTNTAIDDKGGRGNTDDKGGRGNTDDKSGRGNTEDSPKIDGTTEEQSKDDANELKDQSKSSKKVGFDTEAHKKTGGIGGAGTGKKEGAEKTKESDRNNKNKQPLPGKGGSSHKDENVRGSKNNVSDKTRLNNRRGSKASLLSVQGVPGANTASQGKAQQAGADTKDTVKGNNNENDLGINVKETKGKSDVNNKITKRDSKLSVTGDEISRDGVKNGELAGAPLDTTDISDRGKGAKDDGGVTPSNQSKDANADADKNKENTKSQTTSDKDGTSKDQNSDKNKTQKSTTSKSTVTTTTTTTKTEGKSDQGFTRDKDMAHSPSQGQHKDDAELTDNQQPKKQVRIVSPADKAPGKTTRAVSPGIGKNHGGYKVPKKFETTKSVKETTRAQSPSLFQKGLYNEPDKFEVRKSDKALTKAEGPDLGQGEYTAPKPFETTKTERYVRGKSPFGAREKRSKTDIEPESYRRRTDRTDKTERKVRELEPKRNTRGRNYNHDADDEGDEPRARPVRGANRNNETTTSNDPRRTRPEPEKGGGRRVRTEVTETKTIRRRRPGQPGDEDEVDEDLGRQTTPRAKKRTVRKTSPRRRKESKPTKPSVPATSQDHNRPDIPTPELDTSDDEDDIFERAKRKYGIVLDSD